MGHEGCVWSHALLVWTLNAGQEPLPVPQDDHHLPSFTIPSPLPAAPVPAVLNTLQPLPRPMATQPSRKKSLVGANGALPFIDIPQPSNQLLNKSAASSTSLYQRCSQLRSKLVRIDGFAPFLVLASPVSAGSNRQSHSTDPVRQIWDCLLLGYPLVFLWNLIPGRKPIDINTNIDEIDLDNVKERKRATAKFIIALTELKNSGDWTNEVFTITELHSETRDTNGFVKVSGASRGSRIWLER